MSIFIRFKNAVLFRAALRGQPSPGKPTIPGRLEQSRFLFSHQEVIRHVA